MEKRKIDLSKYAEQYEIFRLKHEFIMEVAISIVATAPTSPAILPSIVTLGLSKYSYLVNAGLKSSKGLYVVIYYSSFFSGASTYSGSLESCPLRTLNMYLPNAL